MRLAGALSLAMAPFAAAAWIAVRSRATGADGGVLWCIALLSVLVAFCVVAAHVERRQQ